MHFDPDAFGAAMGELVAEAVLPLKARIAELEKQLVERPDIASAVAREVALAVADLPAPRDGRDCDMDEVRAMVAEALDALPKPVDGKSVTIEDVRPLIDEAVMAAHGETTGRISVEIPQLVRACLADDPPSAGPKGEPGADGAGIADLLIDRDGCLVATMTDGRMKNLGVVVGRDGKDGVGLESFEAEYLADSHEIVIRAGIGDRVREARYSAGGIRLGGYWREGVKAQSGEAYSHKGSLWIARRETASAPNPESRDWVLAARHGKDGERGPKGADSAPPPPVNLKK